MADKRSADTARTGHVDPTNPHSPEPTGTHPYDERGHAVGIGPKDRGAKIGLLVLAGIVALGILAWLFGATLFGADEAVAPAESDVVAPAESG